MPLWVIKKEKEMADTEKNVDFKKDAKAAEAKVEAKKSKKSLAWWAGVVVLILISITFILPATGIGALFAEDSIVFFYAQRPTLVHEAQDGVLVFCEGFRRLQSRKIPRDPLHQSHPGADVCRNAKFSMHGCPPFP